MTNKLVVVINSLKIPKIKKLLLYETKFLVPNYSCLQNHRLGCYPPPPPDPHSLCPLSSTEFVEPPRTKFLGTPLADGEASGVPTVFYEDDCHWAADIANGLENPNLSL